MLKYILFTLSFTCINAVYSQKSISGKVLGYNEQPIPFVNIYIQNTDIVTVSKNDGSFILYLGDQKIDNDTLVASYIGYRTFKSKITSKTKSLRIKLRPDVRLLNEVEIVSHKNLTSNEIIQLSIKSIKKNYFKQSVNLYGYYRELIKEGDKYIAINEATVNLFYTKYPHRKVDRRAWLNFFNRTYELDFVYRKGAVIFGESMYFNYFNDKNDQCKIIESRSSQNQSKYDVHPVPRGGLLSLTGNDKVKYFQDFLNPKVVKKYEFIKLKPTLINGNDCYVLGFSPFIADDNFYRKTNEKAKSAIFKGKIYIDKSSFAIIKYECELFNSFKIYKERRMPIKNQLSIEYQYEKPSNKWYLKSIWTKQNNIDNKGNKPVYYECIRSFQVDSINIDGKNDSFTNKNILKHEIQATLKYFTAGYNTEYWKTFDKSKIHKLSDEIRFDLEHTTKLEEQYTQKDRFDSSLTTPIATREDTGDAYKWIENDTLLDTYEYIIAENNYYNNYKLKVKKQQKRYYKKLLDYYQQTERKKITRKSNNPYYWSERLLLKKNDTTNEVLFNLGAFTVKNSGTIINSIQFNHSYNRFAINYSKNGGIKGTSLIYDLNKMTFTDTIDKSNYINWIDSITCIYTKQDERLRDYKVETYDCFTKKRTLIVSESDVKFDFTIEKNEQHNLIKILKESKDEFKVFLINKNKVLMELQPELTGRLGNAVIGGKHIYKYYNDRNDSCFVFRKRISESNWSLIYAELGQIEAITETKSYVCLNTYNSNHCKLLISNIHDVNWSSISMNEDEFYTLEFEKEINLLNDTLKLNYSSNLTPFTKNSYDLSQLKLINSIRDSAFKSIEKEKYSLKLEFVTTSDGARIPLYILHKKEVAYKGCLIKVYGAYGSKFYPTYLPHEILLMDQGFTIAFAGVRGGSDNGMSWYYDGKMKVKKNSITDFITCTEYLIENNVTTPNYLAAFGNSAGGVVVGQAVNLRPELFNTVILDHPYLDVLTTMLDSSLCLTTEEYLEWGNPNDPKYYHYIESYSPYQNIKKKDYPNFYIMAGFNDNQTPYWQTVKYAAKLRYFNTANSEVILRTDFKGGHTPVGSMDANNSFLIAFLMETMNFKPIE